jgi:hypothetical protein
MKGILRVLIAPVLGILILVSGVAPAFASSHREAPLTAADPQIDSTDLYAFVSPDAPDTVTLISNWIPFEEPAGGPNFYPWAPGVRYDINIDNNGDAKPDLIYRWVFKSNYRNPGTFLMNTGQVKTLRDETLNFYQTYTLSLVDTKTGRSRALVTNGIATPSYVGAASMPDYASLRREAITSFGSGGKSFVGQGDDPFFLDLRVFDLLYGTDLKEAGNDTLDGYNVNVIALQVPKNQLAAAGDATKNPIVGVWTTAQRQSVRTQSTKGAQRFAGPFVQVSRLGQPLVNEVVAPVGSKDLFSASLPQNDAQFLPAVQDPEVPKLLEAIYKIKAPAAPRNDLVQVFLTGIKDLNQPPNVVPSEQLRLNMSISPSTKVNRLGVIGGDNAGFPNGRRLEDDVIDIALRAMAGAVQGVKTELGDGVDANDVSFDSSFPYVAMPNSGSDVAGTGTTTKVATKTEGVPNGAAIGIGIGALILGVLLMALLRPGRKPPTASAAAEQSSMRRAG